MGATTLENTRTFALETDKLNSSKKDQIIEREIIEEVFELVTTEKGSFLAIGKHRVTELKDKEVLKKEIKKKDWKLISSVIIALIGIEKEL